MGREGGREEIGRGRREERRNGVKWEKKGERWWYDGMHLPRRYSSSRETFKISVDTGTTPQEAHIICFYSTTSQHTQNARSYNT